MRSTNLLTYLLTYLLAEQRRRKLVMMVACDEAICWSYLIMKSSLLCAWLAVCMCVVLRQSSDHPADTSIITCFRDPM